jgi:hypothetical protein
MMLLVVVEVAAEVEVEVVDAAEVVVVVAVQLKLQLRAMRNLRLLMAAKFPVVAVVAAVVVAEFADVDVVVAAVELPHPPLLRLSLLSAEVGVVDAAVVAVDAAVEDVDAVVVARASLLPLKLCKNILYRTA